jgi:hypothetical protein
VAGPISVSDRKPLDARRTFPFPPALRRIGVFADHNIRVDAWGSFRRPAAICSTYCRREPGQLLAEMQPTVQAW